MNTLNKFSLATVLGILSLSASVSYAANAPDISGTYKCNYHDPLGTPPDSTETMVFKNNGNTFKVEIMGEGDTVPYFIGKGIFNKDVSNGFAFMYWQPKTPGTPNIKYLTIKPDGSLVGAFAAGNTDKAASEECTKASTN